MCRSPESKISKIGSFSTIIVPHIDLPNYNSNALSSVQRLANVDIDFQRNQSQPPIELAQMMLEGVPCIYFVSSHTRQPHKILVIGTPLGHDICVPIT